MNDLDILLETTPTKKQLKQTNPEIPAEIKETEKSDSLNPNDTSLGVYPKNKNLNLPPYEFSKLGNTLSTDRYTQSDFLQTVKADKLLSTYEKYQNDIFSQAKKLKIMNRIAILKKIIDYEKNTPSFKSSSPIHPTPKKDHRRETNLNQAPDLIDNFPFHDIGSPYPINTYPPDSPPPLPEPSSKKPKFLAD